MTLSKPARISLILFILSFLLRFFLINKGAYSVDCLSITLQAEKLLDTHTLHYHFGFGYPFVIILAALFIFLGRLFVISDTVLAVNFMSVVFGSLCVPAFYLFVRKIFTHATSFYSAVLLSLCPIFIGVSVFGIGHAPTLFFLLLGLLLLSRYFESSRLSFLLFGALSFGVMGASRIQDFILFLPALTFLFFYHHKILSTRKTADLRKTIRHYLLFISICFFITALFHFPYLLDRSRDSYLAQFNEFQRVSLVPFNPDVIRIASILNIMFLTQTLSILGVLVSVLGFLMLIKERPYVSFFFFLWFIVPLFLFINMQTTIPRHQIILLPSVIVTIGYILVWLMEKGSYFKMTSFSVYILIIILTFGHYMPLFVYRHKYSPITDYSRWLKTVTEADARIIATDISVFIKRYAQRQAMGRMLRDRYILKDAELRRYKKRLNRLLEKGVPIYITDTGLYAYNIGNRFSNFMKDNFTLEVVGKHAYEDWHRGYLQERIFLNTLYRIKKKNED